MNCEKTYLPQNNSYCFFNERQKNKFSNTFPTSFMFLLTSMLTFSILMIKMV